MSSRARNFRRRSGGDDDNNDDDDSHQKKGSSTTTTPTATASTATKSLREPSSTSASKPKKPLNQATTKLLSFADDEDDAAAPSRSKRASSSAKLSSSSSRLAKPSSSHKLTSQKDRLSHSFSSSSAASYSLPSNVQPQAGTYTKEALRELQKNTRTLSSSKPSSEPVIVLKGLLKPPDSAKEDRKLHSEDDDDDDDEDDSDELKDRRDDAKIRLDRDSSSAEALIPDQATINAIRAKRERLRQSRAAAPDYIALDGGSNHGEADGLSDEEPENRTRIAMFGEKAEGPKKGVFEDFDDRGVELGMLRKKGFLVEDDQNDEDEEESIWEEEQVRKGLGKARVDDGGGGNSGVVKRDTQQKFVNSVVSQTVPAGSTSIGGSTPGLGSGMLSITQQGEISLKAFDNNLGRLKVHRAGNF